MSSPSWALKVFDAASVEGAAAGRAAVAFVSSWLEDSLSRKSRSPSSSFLVGSFAPSVLLPHNHPIAADVWDDRRVHVQVHRRRSCQSMEPKVADAWHIGRCPHSSPTHHSQVRPTVVHLVNVLDVAKHLGIVVMVDVILALTNGYGVAEASVSHKGMLRAPDRHGDVQQFDPQLCSQLLGVSITQWYTARGIAVPILMQSVSPNKGLGNRRTRV